MVTLLSLAQAIAGLTAEGLYLEYLPPSAALTAAMPTLTATHTGLAAAADAVLLSGC
jgi:hypothetical protein